MSATDAKKKSLLSTAAVMTVMILLSKIFGLLRDILVASAYGTTAPAVAYEAASRLPILLFDLVLGGVVSAAFIPIFSEILVKDGKNAAMRYAAAYVNVISLFTGAITLIGVLFSSPLIRLLAPDLPPETHAMAADLTKLLFPMVICTGLAYAFVGILQSLGEFFIPALISLVSNTIMVLYLVFIGDRFGVTGLAVAMLIGWAAQAVVQIPKLIRFGFRPSLKAGLFIKDVHRSLRLALPILIGTWTQPICSLMNTRFASALEEGRAITALGYANRLYTILVGVFSFVATNLLFPYFSRADAQGDGTGSRKLMHTSLKTLSFIIAPIAAGLAVLAEPICAILYERGEFTPADTALCAEALRAFAVGMLFLAANEVLTKAFFAQKKPVLPMISSLAAMAANIGFVILLAPHGISGIALASGLAVAVQCLLNAALMKKHTGGTLPPADLFDLVKSVLAAALMAVGVHFLYPYLPGSTLLSTLIAALLGVILYAIATAIFHSEETRFILAKLLPPQPKGGKNP